MRRFHQRAPDLPFFQIIEQNSRMPEFARGDLQALVAATKIAGKRMQGKFQKLQYLY
jgi:N-methylhydantoinase B/oxoprolinase/acetone carboxylase alpha subunit